MQNPMINIKIEKVTLNIGVGGPGDKLSKAKKLLEKITDSKAVETKTMKRIPTWGLRPNLPIACKITLRGERAKEVLTRLLKAVDNKLDEKKFDNTGNFSFGIKEYLDIPGVEYDPGIGVIGLEVAVTLERPGFRIKRRRVGRNKIASKHRITKQEAQEFIKNKFNVNIFTGEEE